MAGGIERADATADASITSALAEYCTARHPTSVSTAVIAQTKLAILDLLGCAIAGLSSEAGSILAEYVAADDSSPRATVIGRGFQSSAAAAALVNATVAHVLDFDDIGPRPGTGHPGCVVIPAALATAEAAGASGLDLLDAIAVGYQVSTAVGDASGGTSGDAFQRGLHGTGVFGVFGATAAASRLLGLNQAQAAHAFGIAASSSNGIRANFATMTKSWHAGTASRDGVVAASLAARGFTANPRGMETRHGWVAAVAGGTFDQTRLFERLDSPQPVIAQGISTKLYPSCGATHAVLYALEQLLAESGDGSPVTRVVVRISADVLHESLIPDWPVDELQARFSLPFCLLAMAVDRHLGLPAFTAARLAELAPHRHLVDVIGRDGGRARAAELEVTFADGTCVRRPCPPLPEQGPDAAALLRKFQQNTAYAGWATVATTIATAVDRLDDETSVERLTRLLFASP